MSSEGLKMSYEEQNAEIRAYLGHGIAETQVYVLRKTSKVYRFRPGEGYRFVGYRNDIINRMNEIRGNA